MKVIRDGMLANITCIYRSSIRCPVAMRAHAEQNAVIVGTCEAFSWNWLFYDQIDFSFTLYYLTNNNSNISLSPSFCGYVRLCVCV